jgi:hypothetical protein
VTDLRKAAEMALEALAWGQVDDAKEALHQALAQPDLAKVGEVGVWGHKREWVGLTSDETWEIFTHYDPLQYSAFSRAIEAKLKEKNA